MPSVALQADAGRVQPPEEGARCLERADVVVDDVDLDPVSVAVNQHVAQSLVPEAYVLENEVLRYR
jgi:hypothetical protein